MNDEYYKPCKEKDICDTLTSQYWNSKQYDQWFKGHLVLAEQGYPLAECQVGFAYLEGIGTEKSIEKGLHWTQLAAEHGDRDGQCNLAELYEQGIGVIQNVETAKHWYYLAALQKQEEALNKCKELSVDIL